MRKPTTGQFYLDLGAPDINPQTIDTTTHTSELPGQTTFDLFDTTHIVSIIGDGTLATLH